MKRLLVFLLCSTALFAQSGGQPVNISIPVTSFELGYGESFSQTLSMSPADLQAVPANCCTDGVYTLRFSATNIYASYPGYYTAEIDFGTQELCEASGWGIRNHADVTIVCPGPDYIVFDQSLPSGGLVQGAEPLKLTFTVNDGSFNGGWPLKFDNVSLAFAPVS